MGAMMTMTSAIADGRPDMPGRPAQAAEPLPRRALSFTLALGLHAALLAWILSFQVATPAIKPPVALDVRLIEAAPQPLPEPVSAAPKPLPQAARPEARDPEPIPPPPAPSAAPSAESAPAESSAPAPAREAVHSVPPEPQPPALTEARFDADYLQNPAPAYPPMSRRLREEGRVLLLVRVSETGAAQQVEIKQRSGYARLDEAALKAVRQWHFVPARRGDEAVAASVVVPIVFRLMMADAQGVE